MSPTFVEPCPPRMEVYSSVGNRTYGPVCCIAQAAGRPDHRQADVRWDRRVDLADDDRPSRDPLRTSERVGRPLRKAWPFVAIGRLPHRLALPTSVNFSASPFHLEEPVHAETPFQTDHVPRSTPGRAGEAPTPRGAWFSSGCRARPPNSKSKASRSRRTYERVAFVARIAAANMTKVRTEKAPRILQVADVLQRAHRLPIGAARNDLRQLAIGLLKRHRAGVCANVQIIEERTSR